MSDAATERRTRWLPRLRAGMASAPGQCEGCGEIYPPRAAISIATTPPGDRFCHCPCLDKLLEKLEAEESEAATG